MKGRVLALDLGSRRIGLAISGPLHITAQPLTTLEASGPRRAIEEIGRIVRERGVERVIVGLPLLLNGSRGVEARKAERFAAELGRALDLPVETWDERLTSVQAERVLLAADVSRKRRKEVLDAMSAQILLQSYLDVPRRDDRTDPTGQTG